MEIHIPTIIKQLLYDNETVIVPGLGGFVSQYKSAEVDHVNGVITAPNKTILFNHNLLMNDGLLLQKLQSQYNLSTSDAELTIGDFVFQVKEALDRKEKVTLDNIGALYKDREGELTFLGANENLNKESYGLPSVEFRPLPKEIRAEKEPIQQTSYQPNSTVQSTYNESPKQQSIETVATTTTTSTNTVNPYPAYEEPWYDKLSAWVKSYFPYLALLAIAIAIGSTFYTMYNNKTRVESRVTQQIQNESNSPEMIRINQPPSSETTTADEKITEQTEENYTYDEYEIEATDTPLYDDNTIQNTTATNNKSTNTCIVIVGGFKKDKNVRDLVNKIENDGFKSYTDYKNGLNRVGVQFSYYDMEDLNKTFNRIKRDYESGAWILSK